MNENGLNFKMTGQLRFTGTSYIAILPPYLNIQFLSESTLIHHIKGRVILGVLKLQIQNSKQTMPFICKFSSI